MADTPNPATKPTLDSTALETNSVDDRYSNHALPETNKIATPQQGNRGILADKVDSIGKDPVLSFSRFLTQRTTVLLPTVATAFLTEKKFINSPQSVNRNVSPLNVDVKPHNKDNTNSHSKDASNSKTSALGATAPHPHTGLSWMTLGQSLRRNSCGQQSTSGHASAMTIQNTSPVGSLQISPLGHPLSSVVMTPKVNGAMNGSPREAEQKKSALLHYSPAYNPLADFPGADSYAHYVSSRATNSAPATLRSTASLDPGLIDTKYVLPPVVSLSSAPAVLTATRVPIQPRAATMPDSIQGVHPLSLEPERRTDALDCGRDPSSHDNYSLNVDTNEMFQSSSAPLSQGSFNSFPSGWPQEIQEIRERIMEGRADLETYTLMYQQRQENLHLAVEEYNHLKRERMALEQRIESLETEYRRAKGAEATAMPSFEDKECCLTRQKRAGLLMGATTPTIVPASSSSSVFNPAQLRMAMSAFTAASSSAAPRSPPSAWSSENAKTSPSSSMCPLCQKSDTLAREQGQLRKMDKEMDQAQKRVQKCTSYLNHAKRTYLDPIRKHLAEDQAILSQVLIRSKRRSEGDLLTGYTGAKTVNKF
ncbi:hypothetical protein EMPS_09478 [Entomortierella parvispora]|uniref:Uncharacterized protein n=1 Tax=Entomortierella parvispora TaxID=205924 RepID=A0A9P3HI22_9FUNG|nr:hypothetical protein EMPS_09478 [Entomortierella parvispora]